MITNHKTNVTSLLFPFHCFPYIWPIIISMYLISFLFRHFHISWEAPSSTIAPVHMYQLGSYWTHFCQIWYWRILLKPVKKIQMCLKLGKNIRLHEDLSIFILLAAVQNYLQLDNNAQVTHCCMSIATLNSLYFWRQHVVWQYNAFPWQHNTLYCWHRHI